MEWTIILLCGFLTLVTGGAAVLVWRLATLHTRTTAAQIAQLSRLLSEASRRLILANAAASSPGATQQVAATMAAAERAAALAAAMRECGPQAGARDGGAPMEDAMPPLEHDVTMLGDEGPKALEDEPYPLDTEGELADTEGSGVSEPPETEVSLDATADPAGRAGQAS